jgi:putative spermidine/putrescine transport system permease protein
MTTEAAQRPSGGRRLASWLHRHPRARVGGLLAGPIAWLVLAYLGSLAILLLNAFWESDAFSGRVLPNWTLASFEQLFTVEVYRTIAIRTIVMAIAVTLTDALLAFPIAYYMARVATGRSRAILVIAVTMPLWASYLVKVYAWRVILQGNGIIDWALTPLGLSGPGLNQVANSWIVLTYLWLPYMIVPIYAGLERIPGSLVEASGDLGAKAGTTFRRVILPLVLPSVAAGSIFTFSLTLGDYIIPQLIGSSRPFIGQAVYQFQGTAGDIPMAAAFAMAPIVIMAVYLSIAKRFGAFDAL